MRFGVVILKETKLSRNELTADLVMASGYESFFSCTRTTGPGRVAYSGLCASHGFSCIHFFLVLASRDTCNC